MIYYCEARVGNHIKSASLSASSYEDARTQFMKQSPGVVRRDRVSVCCFNSATSFAERNKGVKY